MLSSFHQLLDTSLLLLCLESWNFLLKWSSTGCSLWSLLKSVREFSLKCSILRISSKRILVMSSEIAFSIVAGAQYILCGLATCECHHSWVSATGTLINFFFPSSWRCWLYKLVWKSLWARKCSTKSEKKLIGGLLLIKFCSELIASGVLSKSDVSHLSWFFVSIEPFCFLHCSCPHGGHQRIQHKHYQ